MEIPIKFNLPDQEPVDPLGQALLDTIVATSGVRPRPGTKMMLDTEENAPITGIFDWEEQGYIIVVVNGKVLKLSNSGGRAYLLLENGVDRLLLEDGSGRLLLETEASVVDVSNDTVFNSNRAIFADFGDYLYIAHGGRIVELHPRQSIVDHNGKSYKAIRNNINVEPGEAGSDTYWEELLLGGGEAWNSLKRYGSGTVDYLEDIDCPTIVKWIGVADRYLLALSDNTQKMYFSVVNEPWNWDQDYVSAEFMPDDAVCLRVFNGDVWVGGRKTIQSFNNDGVTPWVNSSYGAIKNGVLAPYSMVGIGNQTAYYIDEQRRLVFMKDRAAVNVNESINTFLNGLAVVDDAIADYIVLDGIQFYIIQFPTEERTIAVNIDNGSWSEWTYKPDHDNLRWNTNCLTYVPSMDLVVMGDTIHGFVETIDSSNNFDLDIPIQATIRTPRIQTTNRIFVRDLEVGLTKVVRTTAHPKGFPATLRVRWRDDGKDWSNYLEKVVDSDNTDHLVHFRRVGSYCNNRQYEFDCTDLYPYAIKRVDET